MPEISNKSPRLNYATRSAEDKPNIVYPVDIGPPALAPEEQVAAEYEYEDQGLREASGIVVDGAAALAAIVVDNADLLAGLHSAVDTAVTAGGEVTACNTALDAIFTNAAIKDLIDPDELGTVAEDGFVSFHPDGAFQGNGNTTFLTDLGLAGDPDSNEAGPAYDVFTAPYEAAVDAAVTSGERAATKAAIQTTLDSGILLGVFGATLDPALAGAATLTYSYTFNVAP